MAKCIDCKHCVDDRTYGHACDAHGCRSAIFCDLTEPGPCNAFVPRKPIDIVSQIGLPATLEQLAEECCELGHAALKLARKLRDENPTPKTEHECKKNLTEEIADVMVCLNVLEENKIIDMYDVEIAAEGKDHRWWERLSEKGGRVDG